MKDAIYQQLGAAVDSLEDSIRAYPDTAWESGERWHQPWYLAFHVVFWFDYYLSEGVPGYRPPAPFTLGELEPDAFPKSPYTKTELLDWLRECRRAMDARLATLGNGGIHRRCRLPWGEMTAVELLLYNLRHLQHHVAQLNLMIRQAGGEPASWVIRADGLENA